MANLASVWSRPASGRMIKGAPSCGAKRGLSCVSRTAFELFRAAVIWPLQDGADSEATPTDLALWATVLAFPLLGGEEQ